MSIYRNRRLIPIANIGLTDSERRGAARNPPGLGRALGACPCIPLQRWAPMVNGVQLLMAPGGNVNVAAARFSRKCARDDVPGDGKDTRRVLKQPSATRTSRLPRWFRLRGSLRDNSVP